MAFATDDPDRLLGALADPVHAEHARALAGEEDGRRLAVAEARAARARARHDRDLVLQAIAHGRL